MAIPRTISGSPPMIRILFLIFCGLLYAAANFIRFQAEQPIARPAGPEALRYPFFRARSTSISTPQAIFGSFNWSQRETCSGGSVRRSLLHPFVGPARQSENDCSLHRSVEAKSRRDPGSCNCLERPGILATACSLFWSETHPVPL